MAARRFARQVLALSSRQLALLNRLGCERRRKQEDARHRAAVAEAERQRGGIPRSDFSAGGIVPSLPDKETGTAAAVGTAEAGSPMPAVPPGPEGALNHHERRALASRRRKARKRLAGAA